MRFGLCGSVFIFHFSFSFVRKFEISKMEDRRPKTKLQSSKAKGQWLKLINQSLLCTKRQTRLVQYRERSDRMPHSILCGDSQDRFVECGIRSLRRGTVLMGSCGLAKLDSLCKAINNSPMIIFPRGAQSRF